jgi:hypothetical protein
MSNHEGRNALGSEPKPPVRVQRGGQSPAFTPRTAQGRLLYRRQAFFEKPLRFRGLFAQAEEDDVAAQLDDADLASAARQIRELYAAAGQMPAA